MTILAEHQIASVPQVTAAVALFNGRDFVLDCLESVSAQTIPGLDLIVVDDGSQDGGADEVRKWLESRGGRFARSTVIQHETSQGIAVSRNEAFVAARTDYVFVLDSDNLIYPRCLQQLAAVLDRTAASFSYCYLETLGAEIGLRNVDEWEPAMLQFGNPIDGMVMIRRNVWQNIGGYTTDMPVSGWEDLDLWFRIAGINGWGVRVPEVLGRYRVHMKPMGRGAPAPRMHEMQEYFRERHPDAFGIREKRSGR